MSETNSAGELFTTRQVATRLGLNQTGIANLYTKLQIPAFYLRAKKGITRGFTEEQVQAMITYRAGAEDRKREHLANLNAGRTTMKTRREDRRQTLKDIKANVMALRAEVSELTDVIHGLVAAAMGTPQAAKPAGTWVARPAEPKPEPARYINGPGGSRLVRAGTMETGR